ncbi:MAG: phosphatase PAP2 family protein [Sulfurimonas sp.]|uniref:phosphatase PAP2 family protein n=1 Tax=Sulfurimonas sp. TaxID=2022749 RepID=UPI002635F3D5|nr:phosphatase PAP2 family protein [Sulfurimonas sp.]MDD2651453.1 phosphatase PAP2 family protein [Sulfurimonas sp.]MDD3450994.1 phosphatase PAP2 family protein [Sulfurimonas sp.]
MTTKKQLLLTAFLLISVFFFFEYSATDIIIQDFFFDKASASWLLSHKNGSLLDMLFYTGIKAVLIGFGTAMLVLYIYSFRNTPKGLALKGYRRGLFVVWTALLTVPLLIGALKAATNTPCPCHFTRYGGEYPHIKVLDTMPTYITKKFKCFPAGHASGGFALLSLFFLFKTQRNRQRAIFAALGIGWSMGLYKMVIGDHYLSHTLITMIMSWFIILLIYKISSLLHQK